jgi:ABC-type Na+ efflux pump permease subunit
MKRNFSFFLMIVCLPLLLGMGSQGGTPADKIPVPARKFIATLVDQMDITTQCSDVSIEGGTALQGKVGEGTYTVDFENIQEVVFRQHSEKLNGQVKMRDGSSIELIIGKDKKAYGRTKFGTFQIRLNDLKKMIIEPALQKKS